MESLLKGVCYCNGVKQDYLEIKRWFEESAKQGNEEAKEVLNSYFRLSE